MVTKTIVIRNAFQRSRSTFATVGKSLTQQEFKDECDINRVMLKWQKHGVLEHRNTFEGQYGDFSNIPSDYHSAMNAVVEAQEMFMTLPSSVRKRFANDPGNFLEFVTDEKNVPEMVKMGLATARKDAPTLVEPKDEPTPPKKAKAAPEPPPAPSEGAE